MSRIMLSKLWTQERPLTGKFEDYLTYVDVSSPCEQLPPDYQAHLDKEWWETVDQDLEYQEGK